MGRTQPLLIALLVVVGVGIVPSTVVADDNWPDSTACSVSDAPVVETTGDYNVQINSPNDIDVIKFRLQKGKYVYFSTVVPDSVDSLAMHFEENEAGGQDKDFSITELNNVNLSGSNTAVGGFTSGVRSSWKFWGEEEGTQTYCVIISEHGEADVPYEFTLKARLNSPEPATVETTTPTPTAAPTRTPTPTPTSIDSSGGSESTGRNSDDVQDSDGDGVIDSEDYAPRDPDVQAKSDLQETSGGSGPGFGIMVAVVGLLITTFVVLRRS